MKNILSVHEIIWDYNCLNHTLFLGLIFNGFDSLSDHKQTGIQFRTTWSFDFTKEEARTIALTILQYIMG